MIGLYKLNYATELTDCKENFIVLSFTLRSRCLLAQTPVAVPTKRGCEKSSPIKTNEDREFIRAQGPSFVLKLIVQNILTSLNFNAKQAIMPLFVSDFLDICDPVLTFR